MDGDVGNGQKRPVPCHKAAFGAHGVRRAHQYDAGEAQRTIQPGVVDRAAVRLDVQLAAAAGNDLRLRLDAQAGPVGVRCGDAEGRGAFPHGEGDEIRAVFDEIAAALFDGKIAAERQPGKTGLLKLLRRHRDGMIRGNAAVEPAAECLFQCCHRDSSSDCWKRARKLSEPSDFTPRTQPSLAKSRSVSPRKHSRS